MTEFFSDFRAGIITFRPALGPTDSATHWVPLGLCPGLRGLCVVLTNQICLVVRLRMRGVAPVLTHTHLYCGTWLSTGRALSFFAAVYLVSSSLHYKTIFSQNGGLHSLLAFSGYFQIKTNTHAHAHIYLASMLQNFIRSLPYISLTLRQESHHHRKIIKERTSICFVVITTRRLLDLASKKWLHGLIWNKRFIPWVEP